jgi:aspartyl-tRNA(Asn)/glutamyl-tRNA(Gln) amidotransferase subunit A
VASVQEGSAAIAIGTDTGGSIRVPAALGGLAGYRASLGRGDWRGGAHLAQSFDTLGCIFADLADAPIMAALFADDPAVGPRALSRFGVVEDGFSHDCEPEILEVLRATVGRLEALGLKGSRVDAGWWAEAMEIFAPIQAWEAARLHAGHFDRFERTIRERLEWGAGIGEAEIAGLRGRHGKFRDRMDELLAVHELLLLPAAPVARLAAGADHSRTRMRLLRYTAPFSVAGVPVVTVPGAAGGVQMAAARNCDEALLGLAARLGVS